MTRTVRLFLALLLAASVTHASTTESIGGHLENGRAGEVVLTLDLPSARLASLADKAGQEADHDGPALAELVRERLHYLLRLRVGNRHFAPTSVKVPVPDKGQPLPEFIPLRVTWANVPPDERAEVVTQVDSPDYRLALAVADRRDASSATSAGDTPAPAKPVPAQSWLRAVSGGALTGVARLVPGGVLQLLFVLGLYFSARDRRELVLRLSAFLVAHSVALGLGSSGIVDVPVASARGLDVAAGLSLVALAVANCLTRPPAGRRALILFAAVGALHGLGLVRAFADVRWPEGAVLPAVAGAVCSIAFILLAVLGLTELVSGARRSDLAIPASVVIGLGGLTWTFA